MKITVEDYRRTQTKHRKAKKGHGWTNMERIEMDCMHLGKFEIGSYFLEGNSVSFPERCLRRAGV